MMSALTHPLIVNTIRCTGCQICEISCSLEKEGICNPQLSRIRVLRQDTLAVYIPVISTDCDLCGRCIKLCPTEAIRFVEMDEAVLLRKKMSIEALFCPIVGGKSGKEIV